MSKLQEYLHSLDNKQSLHTERHEIDATLQKIRDELSKNGDEVNAKLAQLEMEVFSFTKRIQNGKIDLTYQFGGTRKNAEGLDIPFEWPDSSNYQKSDYDYVFERFKTSKNNYAKIEYGFVLLFGNESTYKNNNITKEIIKSLFQLIDLYFDKITEDLADEKHYGLYFVNNIEYLFYLTKARKDQDEEIHDSYNRIIQFVYETIKNWNLNYQWTLRAIAELSKLIINNYTEYTSFDLDIILEKIWGATKQISINYEYGGIELADIGDTLETKTKGKRNIRWLKLQGDNFERLAKSAKENNENTYVGYIEDALKVYKEIGETAKIEELENIFFSSKSKARASEISTTFTDSFKQILA
mgnify:CR=1 FL=1